MPEASRRVAVTGIGAITPFGFTSCSLWNAALAGASPIRRITRFDASEFRSQIAAEIDGFDFADFCGDRKPSKLDRFSQFAVAASRQALLDANIQPDEVRGSYGAVYLGSALGGIAFGEQQHQRFLETGIRSVAPALALSVFAGAGATNVSIEFGLRGPAISNANSCASGAIAIGDAFHLIRDGSAALALAGGVECPLAPLTFGSFAVIKAMSRRNDDPAGSCRPFDRGRDGFVMGEGAGVLVLEEWEQARRRGARIHAEVVGYASTNDAHHMTVPLPDGSEASRAMLMALTDAGLEPADVDYVNAHATGTPLGDAAEAAALRLTFGDTTPPVSATKPLHGHALGASPAIEAGITAMVLEHGFMPGTPNLTDADGSCSITHVRPGGQALNGRVAMTNAFGFGGTNASLVMAAPQDEGFTS